MMWVEILSRHRDVAARVRIAGDEACIGRSYENDVVVDDPFVAAHHVRIFRDGEGRLVAEDAGSKNGMFLDRERVRRERIVIDPEHPIRIGHMLFRVRSADYSVPNERLAGVRAQIWPAIAAAGLAVSVLGVETLSVWLTQTAEPRVSTYLNSLLFISALALAWVTGWTVLTRIFSGQARFLQNLVIALSGLLFISVYRQVAQITAFAFTWPAAIGYQYAVQSCVVAAVCFFHLRETGRTHLALKGVVVAALMMLAIAVQILLQSEALSDGGQQTVVRRLMPPALRLAPVRAESDFFADIERLKAGLDRLRSQP